MTHRTTETVTYIIRTTRGQSLEPLLRFYQFDFERETEARHLLSCAMVKHPNCTHCDCGSSIDEPTRASSGARPDQPHTRAQGILDTASGSVRVSATDPSGTPQDIGRASGSEVRQAREPNPGSGVPAPGAAPRETVCRVNQTHEGYYYCRHCGLDLTPDLPEQHGRYNDSAGAARSLK